MLEFTCLIVGVLCFGSVFMWHGGILVGTIDMQLRTRVFDLRRLHFRVTTLASCSHTHTPLCAHTRLCCQAVEFDNDQWW